MGSRIIGDLPNLTQNEREALEILIKRLKEYLGENLITIRIFGSKLRGDFREDSDIDILLVLKERTVEIHNKIAEIAADIDLEYDPQISLVVYSDFEYEKNRELGSPFVESVEKEGIVL